jgi:thiol-disulfide isomerase/thioredoxin
MRIIRVFLYTAFLACANVAVAGSVDPAMLTGAMAKLTLEAPKPLPQVALVGLADEVTGLEGTKGKWLVLNLWATWCMPCREEMPSLDRLATLRPDIAVVAVATGPNPLPAIHSFLDKAGVHTLTVLRDPTQDLAHQMGVMGLPVTVIVNPEGMEVARLIGGADWSAPETLAVLEALK